MKTTEMAWHLKDRDIIMIGETEYYVWENLQNPEAPEERILTLVDRKFYDNDWPDKPLHLTVQYNIAFAITRN